MPLISLSSVGTQGDPTAFGLQDLGCWETYSIPTTEGAEFTVSIPWCNHNTKATHNLQHPPLELKTETSGTDCVQPSEWVQLQTLVNFPSVPATASCGLLCWSWIQAEVQHCRKGKVHVRTTVVLFQIRKKQTKILSFLQRSSQVQGWGKSKINEKIFISGQLKCSISLYTVFLHTWELSVFFIQD